MYTEINGHYFKMVSHARLPRLRSANESEQEYTLSLSLSLTVFVIYYYYYYCRTLHIDIREPQRDQICIYITPRSSFAFSKVPPGHCGRRVNDLVSRRAISP